MVVSDVRERGDQSHPGSGPAFDLVASKLRCPPPRPGTIHRSSLIDRLARPDCGPIVSLVAPAGYGKTTLLSHWAEHHPYAFATRTQALDWNSQKLLPRNYQPRSPKGL